MYDVHIRPDPALERLLKSHPRIGSVVEDLAPSRTERLAWAQDGRERTVLQGAAGCPLRGVVELLDNNPLVCADAFSVPGPAATLASLALGPLAEAGLIAERPTMLVNIEADESEIAPFLDPLGWRDGLTVAHEPVDLGTVAAATVIAAITTPGRLEDLDDLYVERYGRSFYVERDESESWDAERVMGRPQAEYRLRVTPGDEHSLLTIQIMSDREGKCGAAQLVHAMNVMCGFEESLGIPDRGSGKTRL